MCPIKAPESTCCYVGGKSQEVCVRYKITAVIETDDIDRYLWSMKNPHGRRTKILRITCEEVGQEEGKEWEDVGGKVEQKIQKK